jgi:hypothetical protein
MDAPHKAHSVILNLRRIPGFFTAQTPFRMTTSLMQRFPMRFQCPRKPKVLCSRTTSLAVAGNAGVRPPSSRNFHFQSSIRLAPTPGVLQTRSSSPVLSQKGFPPRRNGPVRPRVDIRYPNLPLLRPNSQTLRPSPQHRQRKFAVRCKPPIPLAMAAS